MDLDKIEEALKIAELYRYNINLYAHSTASGTSIDYLKFREVYIDDYIVTKARLIQIANEITVCNEMIGDSPEDDVKESLSQMLTSCAAFNKINSTNMLEPENLRKYIRNIFAHAGYTLNKDYTVHFKYGDVEFDILWSELDEIKKYYIDAFQILKNGLKVRLLDNCESLVNLKNINALIPLRKSIDEIKKSSSTKLANEIMKMDTQAREENHINQIAHSSELQLYSKLLLNGVQKYGLQDIGGAYNCISLDLLSGVEGLLFSQTPPDIEKYLKFVKLYREVTDFLSGDEKVLLENYIRYYYAVWNRLSKDTKTKYILDFSKNVLSKSPIFQEKELYLFYPLYIVSRDVGIDSSVISEFLPYSSTAFKYVSPAFGQVSLTLDLLYFCFGFTNETTSDSKLYSDYNINSFKETSLYSCGEFEENYEEVLKAEKRDNIRRLNKMKKELNGIQKGLNSNKRNQKQLENLKTKFNQTTNDIEKLTRANSAIDSELMNPNHTNQTRFFSHIRNSLTHGYFSLDYSQSFVNRDMLETIIEFKDYDKHRDGIETFSARINLKQALRICDTFISKLENEKMKQEQIIR